MSKHTRLIAGAMSGTSADGVDVAITEITGRGLDMTARLVRHHHRSYPPSLRQEIFSFRGGEERAAGTNVMGRLAQMGREISLTYATAVNECLAAAQMSAKDLACVAAHGQTLFHDPPNTIQWFDPSLVAAEVGCAVVSDFRRADLAAGGQGAPLVPFADYILFRHPTKNRVLLNIGGIANITWLKAGGTIEDVIAFDTGPGNCISDWICRTRGPFDLSWDIDGQGASRGKIVQPLIDQFLRESYFQTSGPKSTDGPAMVDAFLRACGGKADTLEMNDLLATAARLTAMTILRGIGVREADELLCSGGGIHNKSIMQWLRQDIGDAKVRPLGTEADAKEAIAFAMLGAATLDGVPSNVPSVTGARRAVVLGSVTPKP